MTCCWNLHRGDGRNCSNISDVAMYVLQSVPLGDVHGHFASIVPAWTSCLFAHRAQSEGKLVPPLATMVLQLPAFLKRIFPDLSKMFADDHLALHVHYEDLSPKSSPPVHQEFPSCKPNQQIQIRAKTKRAKCKSHWPIRPAYNYAVNHSTTWGSHCGCPRHFFGEAGEHLPWNNQRLRYNAMSRRHIHLKLMDAK